MVLLEPKIIPISTPLSASVPSLHVIQFSFESFDGAVSNFEILVELVALGDEVLLPLTETSFLGFDLDNTHGF